MKTIPLRKAYEILENCSAIIIDNNVLVYPSLSKIMDVDMWDEEFLTFRWEAEGLEYELSYQEGDNKKVEINGSHMILKNTSGKFDKITILEPKNIEEIIKKTHISINSERAGNH